ncbi:Whi4p NDAI_0H03850 [Naumovozyma dairenensis CBS 421]|uniref:RRM domain-containing protein n=1 Tax=Naumovozyma dairenensis (strain ATCC 10597 / BCRC 20456 / CBS 421 / NBRC 0211 / NRRL Y-12639) TaxID=1071378 RepID=G0WFJ7_NAUDC|nr:hypothetical protein NDAI_0H03850 [Naumovozyma dairenensis CBS 421]CCD26558.1 hypothetical protein NDAI_0H03850 [Naumovozyma dairenensis CBS 421]
MSLIHDSNKNIEEANIFSTSDNFPALNSSNLSMHTNHPDHLHIHNKLGLNSLTLRNNSESNLNQNSHNVVSKVNTSPFNLSSMLQNFTLNEMDNNNQNSSINATNGIRHDLPTNIIFQGPFALKIKNIPNDISLRECHAIFALSTNPTHVELVHTSEKNNNEKNNMYILAKFESLPFAAHYASILSSKNELFGPNFPFKPSIELIEEITGKQILFQNIPSVYSHPENYRLISPNDDGRNLNNRNHHYYHPDAPPHSASPLFKNNATNSDFSQQRPSLLHQRSRFSFNDPFSIEKSQQSASQPVQSNLPIFNSQQQQEEQQQQPHNGITISQPDFPVPISATTTVDSGKSFLINEKEEINEKIWSANGELSMNMNTFATNTPQPCTPNLDWNSNSSITNQTNAIYAPPSTRSSIQLSKMDMGTVNMPPPLSQQQQQQQQQFFPPINMRNMNQFPNNTFNDMHHVSTPVQNYGLVNQMPPPPPSSSTTSHIQTGYTNMNSLSNPNQLFDHNTAHHGLNQISPSQQYSSQQKSQSQSQLENFSKVSQFNDNINHDIGGSTTNIENIPVKNSRNLQSTPISSKNQSLPPSSTINVAGSTTTTATASRIDLSLLAKVPPPVNPADQNPPCNTLYVGNLPPDATENELRQLFSCQNGFRRLSFRNKNTNGHGHGHGPMCFVEFEDINFATQALGELYGSQLPRATLSSKGGIRLSFSKNPLGVRGPNNNRKPIQNINTTTSANSNASW